MLDCLNLISKMFSGVGAISLSVLANVLFLSFSCCTILLSVLCLNLVAAVADEAILIGNGAKFVNFESVENRCLQYEGIVNTWFDRMYL